MRSNKSFQIGNLLDRGEASRLLSRARALRKLDAMVHELIPAPLNAHCRVLAIRDDILIIAADSPVWAARLRYETARLTRQLAGISDMMLRTVQVRVRASGQAVPGSRISSARQPLSRRNAMVLKQAARSISDVGLRTALFRLADRRRPESGNRG